MAEGLADIHRGLTIMKSLINADPDNAQKLGIVGEMHLSLAHVFARTGNFPAAIRDYITAAGIFQSLHLQGEHFGRLFKVAVCKNGIADAHRRPGNVVAASENFQEALAIVEPHLKITDAGVLWIAADAYAGLGNIESTKGFRSSARDVNTLPRRSSTTRRASKLGINCRPTLASIQITFMLKR